MKYKRSVWVVEWRARKRDERWAILAARIYVRENTARLNCPTQEEFFEYRVTRYEATR